MARDAGVRSIDALSTFGKKLQKLGENMCTAMQNAQREMHTVSEGWQDDVNDAFKKQFDESVKTVNRMSEEFKQYNAYVQKECEILKQYNSTRMKK